MRQLAEPFGFEDGFYLFQNGHGMFLSIRGAVEVGVVAQVAFNPVKFADKFYDILGGRMVGDFGKLASGMRPAGGMDTYRFFVGV